MFCGKQYGLKGVLLFFVPRTLLAPSSPAKKGQKCGRGGQNGGFASKKGPTVRARGPKTEVRQQKRGKSAGEEAKWAWGQGGDFSTSLEMTRIGKARNDKNRQGSK